jgi:hypothetical protein
MFTRYVCKMWWVTLLATWGKLIENILMHYAEYIEMQYICRYKCLDKYSINIYYFQMAALSGIVVFSNVMCLKIGDILIS